MILNFTTNYPILVSYLKYYFKNHLISYRKKTKTMTIYPNSGETIELLENLLSQNELVGAYINFNYDKQEYEEYKSVLNEKQTRKKRYFALFSLLEEQYNILGCQKKDNFKIIREKYLNLVKQYHPDMLSQSNISLNAHYKQKFEDIQYAYTMLKIHHLYNKNRAIVA